MNDKKNLEKIIESDQRVAVIETTDPLDLTAYMKRLTLTTGRAVYDWSAEHGLYRLGIEHIFIPRTRTPADVLSYITSSRHYGIYLLRDFDETLLRPAVERQLHRLLEKQDNVRRLVFFVGHSVKLPSALATTTIKLRWNEAKEQQRQA